MTVRDKAVQWGHRSVSIGCIIFNLALLTAIMYYFPCVQQYMQSLPRLRQPGAAASPSQASAVTASSPLSTRSTREPSASTPALQACNMLEVMHCTRAGQACLIWPRTPLGQQPTCTLGHPGHPTSRRPAQVGWTYLGGRSEQRKRPEASMSGSSSANASSAPGRLSSRNCVSRGTSSAEAPYMGDIQ